MPHSGDQDHNPGMYVPDRESNHDLLPVGLYGDNFKLLLLRNLKCPMKAINVVNLSIALNTLKLRVTMWFSISNILNLASITGSTAGYVVLSATHVLVL